MQAKKGVYNIGELRTRLFCKKIPNFVSEICLFIKANNSEGSREPLEGDAYIQLQHVQTSVRAHIGSLRECGRRLSVPAFQVRSLLTAGGIRNDAGEGQE